MSLAPARRHGLLYLIQDLSTSAIMRSVIAGAWQQPVSRSLIVTLADVKSNHNNNNNGDNQYDKKKKNEKD